MITRTTALCLLMGMVALAAEAATLRSGGSKLEEPKRRLQEETEAPSEEVEDVGNLFCNCPCSTEGAQDEVVLDKSIVWVNNTLNIHDILPDFNLTASDILTGIDDETGETYQGFCMGESDIFLLAFDYGDGVFCDIECEEDEKDAEDAEDDSEVDLA